MAHTTRYELFVFLEDGKLCQDESLALTVYHFGLRRKLELFALLMFLSCVLTKSFLIDFVFILCGKRV